MEKEVETLVKGFFVSLLGPTRSDKDTWSKIQNTPEVLLTPKQKEEKVDIEQRYENYTKCFEKSNLKDDIGFDFQYIGFDTVCFGALDLDKFFKANDINLTSESLWVRKSITETVRNEHRGLIDMILGRNRYCKIVKYAFEPSQILLEVINEIEKLMGSLGFKLLREKSGMVRNDWYLSGTEFDRACPFGHAMTDTDKDKGRINSLYLVFVNLDISEEVKNSIKPSIPLAIEFQKKTYQNILEIVAELVGYKGDDYVDLPPLE